MTKHKTHKINKKSLENLRKGNEDKRKFGVSNQEKKRLKEMGFQKGHIQDNPNSLKALIPNQFKKGGKLSDEQKQNLSILAKDGKIGFQKGNSINKGRPHTEEWKKQNSIRMKKIWKDKEYRKNFSNKMTGHKVSDETKELIAESRRGDKHWTTRLPYTEEHKAKLREKRLHQVFPLKDTKIEIKMQNVLKSHGIKFQTHVPLKGQPDIYIDIKDGLFHKGLCIFVDGCYWHGCMECYPDNYTDKIPSMQRMRDPPITEYLRVQGYYVMRIPEHIIVADDKFGEKTDLIENYVDIIKMIIGVTNKINEVTSEF